MADKITATDAVQQDKVVETPKGLSPAQAEGYKGTDLKAPAPVTDANLPGIAIDKGAQTVTHPDTSEVVFRQSTNGTAQVQSIKTFDGHTATPGYGDDGTLSKLTIQPRGEEPYTLSRVGEDKFDWLDSRTNDASRRVIEVHAGPNPGSTAEIAIYHEGHGATLFAPEAKVQPDVALKDFASLFGRGNEYPFSSGTAMPFTNNDGTHVSIFDPNYRGVASVTDTGRQSELSARAEVVAIKTEDGRSVRLGFDSAQKGADGRPLVTSANITEADGNKFELKRVGDTDQWRDSRTGTLRNLEVDRAVGKDAASSAEVLIKDIGEPAKTLFFNPHSEIPLLTDKIPFAEIKAASPDAARLIEKRWLDDKLAGIYERASSKLPADLRTALDQSGAAAFKDISRLTDTHDSSLYAKSEELGYAFLKTRGNKIALGLAAAAGLVAAGKWAFSRHNSDAPASLPVSVLPPQHLEFSERLTSGALRSAEFGEMLLPSPKHQGLMRQLRENSKALEPLDRLEK
ncbi:MAG: hypothetical protein P4L53_19510 [Candidatus Obscuribacterales bacterium]|nr:hypothetical protein [Candidatus Obscuribacterales bacterium]